LSSWHSYPSSYNIGHRVLRDFFDHEIVVEEKVDGSQFSFGKFPIINPDTGDDLGDEIRVRSKGAVFPIDAPPKMFKAATDTVLRLAPLLTLGYTYRGEFLSKPKHNSLAYNRTPLGHIILFDVCREEEDYLSYEEKAAEALRLGLECVPKLFEGKIESPVPLRDFFQLESVLGGQKIEGVVCKPKARNVFGTDKKLLLGKFVSEAFKEVHSKTWGEANPTQQDFLLKLIDSYTTPARWNKAVFRLRDEGVLEDSPKDIGKLIASIPGDIKKECEEELKEKLFAHFWPQIRRGVVRGFPEFYKQTLLEKQFETDHKCVGSVEDGAGVAPDPWVDPSRVCP
jgi:hypothetical protein